MATFGFTAAPSYGFVSSGSNNTAAMLLGGFPSPGGYVTQVSVYAGTYTGSGPSYLVIWDSGGNVLFSTPLTIGTTVGWYHSGAVNWYIPAGTTIFVGFQTPIANGSYVEYASSGGNHWDWASVASIPGNFGGSYAIESGEAMGAYVTYTPLTAPTISAISPDPVAPTQTVSLTGTGFLHATGVTIGGVAAASFSITSDTAMTATLAANTPGGPQSLVVTNPAGTGSTTITVGGVAYVNTGTPAAPVWTMGVVYVNTGTPAAPVWTVASEVAINTGTPAAPVWTPGG